jgi:hypothetical protein
MKLSELRARCTGTVRDAISYLILICGDVEVCEPLLTSDGMSFYINAESQGQRYVDFIAPMGQTSLTFFPSQVYARVIDKEFRLNP